MPLAAFAIGTRTYRHINRYRQILMVLFRYGFGGLVDRLRIAHMLEAGWHLISRQDREHVEHLSMWVRVRMALEELGPTFVKLGQVLSTRPDLVPVELAEALTQLQQHVPAFAAAEARRIIESELGAPVDELFERFDDEPIAAASIGQVHRARLRTGEEVVIKVQRPKIREKVEVDLEIMHHLAGLLERHVEEWRIYRPSRIVAEFGRVIHRELDFRVEATQTERFAGLFAGDATVYVPGVYRRYASRRVLTLEYVPVISARDNTNLLANHIDPREVASRASELTLKQIFVHGFFHADPHPGNAFVLPNNVICLLDFGMMGRIDRRSREEFAALIYGVASRDIRRATRALLALTEHDPGDTPNRAALERDVEEFIDIHITPTLGELDFGRLLRELLDLARRHRLYIPADLVTMLKAAATAERLIARLDPELNVVQRAQPYVRRLLMRRLRPRRVLRELYDASAEVVQFTRELPDALRDLLTLARHGSLQVGFEHRGLGDLINGLEAVANRLSYAIVVAALIVGSSLIVHADIPPKWAGLPVIGVVGFLTAGVMGLVLLISILRHVKQDNNGR